MKIGNIVVGQSGGPTSAINASLAGVFQAAKDLGAEKIYGMRHGIEGILKEEFINLSQTLGSDSKVQLLKITPSSALGSCRYKLPKVEKDEQTYQKIFDILKKYDISHFFYIGGNDSMDTIQKLSSYGARIGSNITFIGIPKTIDNDLPLTDHTPGYGSAAKYIAAATKEVIYDASVYPFPAVTIMEIMGRDAGWLTAASSLSRGEDCDGPDLIYLPERPFDVEQFVDNVKEKMSQKYAVVIAVSEGLRDATGTYICDSLASKKVDAFGHRQLECTGKALTNMLEVLHCKTRAIELNTLQRCAAHMLSKTDIDESFQSGYEGVMAASKGETGKMVTFHRISNTPYQLEYRLSDINLIANQQRSVPGKYITKGGTDVSDSIREYIEPLIQGEYTPQYKNGVPSYFRF
ncbi:6-phosphofructokinase [Clostridium facile]|uniref:Pyrophosphate--fructose 6-phosphate 1-phosphotransferase n=1 Tax=Clostridium facile TaxID=2763035 RepID=A0ABR7IQY8_9CLOT|nr:6-phosphofructokinase [Clostridium facile]MBC5787564.1 6-phosphofructokinase [Clostridium facile]